MKNLVYILASSYSGSTLLTLLMANHPSISTVGELKASAMGDISKYVCSCGRLIRECGFWKKVTSRLAGQGIDFRLDDFGTHFRDKNLFCDRLFRASLRGRMFELARDAAIDLCPYCRARYERILEMNRALTDVVCSIQGGRVFLDGSKEPVRLKYLLRSKSWNIKVIHLIREGRGETCSYMRHHGVSMDAAAREWVRTQKESMRIVNTLSEDQCLLVKYEQLCQDTPGVLGSIYDFLGLQSDHVDLNYTNTKHHILGNSMRLRPLKEIRIDEKWKTLLTREDLSVFEQIAGKANRAYGYR